MSNSKRAPHACCWFLACLLAGVLSVSSASAQNAPLPPAAAPQIPGLTNTAPGTARSAPATVSAPTGYQLSPSDQVAVEVFGEDDLRTAARLGEDGSATLPLLGTVRLGGLTLPQAAARITELYGRDYLVNPRVNVTLLAFAKARFTVLGQVNRPGSFEMPDGATYGIDILEAVAIAGGYTRIAAPERITVRRSSDRRDEVIRVNAKKLARTASGPSFRVLAGDRITVGESIF